MTSPRFSFVPVMDHELHVTEWGDPDGTPLIMWHGLARTGRDFDELAAALSDEYFVLCPDTIGRGLSSWSDNPEAEYSVEYYSGIAADLLDFYAIDRAAWIGTSMGALIGMRMASTISDRRFRRMRWIAFWHMPGPHRNSRHCARRRHGCARLMSLLARPATSSGSEWPERPFVGGIRACSPLISIRA